MTPINTQWISSLLPTLPPAPVKTDFQRGVILEMVGIGYGDWRPAFDSSLILHDGTKNHTLTLVLKVFYSQMLHQSLPPDLRVPFFEPGPPPRGLLLRPWNTETWTEFIRDLKKEAAHWNNHFWLVPPANFTKLDVKLGNRTMRPNVYCHLYVHVVDSQAKAYNKVDVLNFDLTNIPANQQNSGLSRSNAAQYHSKDTKNISQWTLDETGQWREAKNFSTIAHEIGHLISLPHIGVTHQDHLCQMAILLDRHVPKSTNLPALFTGGSNGAACYGTFSKIIRGANIMGGGMAFEESNAAPWAQRLALHTGTKPEQWTVVKDKAPPPKPV